jgi:hypothetical protein
MHPGPVHATSLLKAIGGLANERAGDYCSIMAIGHAHAFSILAPVGDFPKSIRFL